MRKEVQKGESNPLQKWATKAFLPSKEYGAVTSLRAREEKWAERFLLFWFAARWEAWLLINRQPVWNCLFYHCFAYRLIAQEMYMYGMKRHSSIAIPFDLFFHFILILISLVWLFLCWYSIFADSHKATNNKKNMESESSSWRWYHLFTIPLILSECCGVGERDSV